MFTSTISLKMLENTIKILTIYLDVYYYCWILIPGWMGGNYTENT